MTHLLPDADAAADAEAVAVPTPPAREAERHERRTPPDPPLMLTLVWPCADEPGGVFGRVSG